MSFPFEDAGFTLWHADVDTQLKRLHGVTSRDLRIERRVLQESYYSGDNVLKAVATVARRHSLGGGGTIRP